MISWVLDRIPARCADENVAHMIIVASESKSAADFNSGRARVFAMTEDGLLCERIGATEWYVREMGDRLVAERDLNQRAAEAAANSSSIKADITADA